MKSKDSKYIRCSDVYPKLVELLNLPPQMAPQEMTIHLNGATNTVKVDMMRCYCREGDEREEADIDAESCETNRPNIVSPVPQSNDCIYKIPIELKLNMAFGYDFEYELYKKLYEATCSREGVSVNIGGIIFRLMISDLAKAMKDPVRSDIIVNGSLKHLNDR